jgi:anti-sigma B factor antagonist
MTAVDEGEQAPSFTARREGDVVLLRGEMASDTAAAMDAAFAPLRSEAASGDVVLDLSGISFCDSTGLNQLAALHRAAAPDHQVRLRAVPPLVRRVLEITGMDAVFPIEP